MPPAGIAAGGTAAADLAWMLNRLLIVTIAGGLLPLGADVWWPLELTAHFRQQYLAVAVVLGSIAWLKRKRILLAGLAATVALNAIPLLPYLPLDRPDSSGTPLTILNINVNAGNLEHDRILDTLRGSEAEIVTLIELSRELDARLDELSDAFPFSLRFPEDGNFGLAVLSRHPLEAAASLRLESTTAISTRVLSPAGTFSLIAAHLAPPVSATLAAVRNAQLVALAALADEAPAETLVICGDFNLSPYSPYFGRFETAARVRDTRRGLGLRISWPSSLPLLGIPIDHCFARGALASERIETVASPGSDHYPVRVRLRWLEQA